MVFIIRNFLCRIYYIEFSMWSLLQRIELSKWNLEQGSFYVKLAIWNFLWGTYNREFSIGNLLYKSCYVAPTTRHCVCETYYMDLYM